MPPKGKKQRPEPEEEVIDVDEIDEDDGIEEEDDDIDVNGFLQTLAPDVRKRVFALLAIQKDFAATYAKYMEEMCALEKKYEDLYGPIFDRRRDIVQGNVEPTEDEINSAAKITEVKEEGESAPVAKDEEAKGIPNFWLGALKNHDMCEQLITERDEECLKFLNDITAKNFDNPNKGFTLTFHFGANPFFSNTTLTKMYHLDDEDEIMLDKAEGCKIDWLPDKNLTVVLKKKKQKQKGGKNTRTVTKEEPCESFFNFFSPPQPPEEEDEEEEDDEEMDELEERMEQDYEVGRTIKDQIIPNAVDWFTGAAIKTLGMDHFAGAFGGGDGDDEDGEGEDNLKGIKPPQIDPQQCKQQ